MSDAELKHNHWQLLYQEVLLEHRPKELHSKIQAAEAAIYERLQAMACDDCEQSEREVLADAVTTLRILQREKLSFPDGIALGRVDIALGAVDSVNKPSTGRIVVVVDDNPAILEAICQAFLADGFGACVTAENGKDAIELVERLSPDIIVLDLSMPEMDGLQTASHLRKIAPHTPIILLTLYSLPKESAAALGVNLVLSKTDNVFSVVSKARELLCDQTFLESKTA